MLKILKAMEQHVLENNNLTADQFYKNARKKLETDMVGNNGRNRSMSAPTLFSAVQGKGQDSDEY